MVSIPKIVGVLSCGLLLCLGLSNAAQAEHAPAPSDVMKTDAQSDRQGFQSDDDKQMNEKKGNSSRRRCQDDQGRTVPRRRRKLFRQGERREGSPSAHR